MLSRSAREEVAAWAQQDLFFKVRFFFLGRRGESVFFFRLRERFFFWREEKNSFTKK